MDTASYQSLSMHRYQPPLSVYKFLVKMANLLCQILIWKKYDGSSLSLRCNFCPKKSKSTRINETVKNKGHWSNSFSKNQNLLKTKCNKTIDRIKNKHYSALKKRDLLEALCNKYHPPNIKNGVKSRRSIKREARY